MAVCHQQIEGKKTRFAAMKEQVIELRSAASIHTNNFTIEDGPA
jgi:hypothetical protein